MCSELDQDTTDCSGQCCFGVVHGEWYGFSDLLCCRGMW